MEKERRDSKEFSFPDDNLLHRRRQSDVQSATQSEDDESVSFEVSFSSEISSHSELESVKIQFPLLGLLPNCFCSNVYLIFRFPFPERFCSPTW